MKRKPYAPYIIEYYVVATTLQLNDLLHINHIKSNKIPICTFVYVCLFIDKKYTYNNIFNAD